MGGKTTIQFMEFRVHGHKPSPGSSERARNQALYTDTECGVSKAHVEVIITGRQLQDSTESSRECVVKGKHRLRTEKELLQKQS